MLRNTGNPIYGTWTNMKSRCSNRNHPKYKYYGQRGISVCDEWINDFDQFRYDMGPRPEGYSLDRIDNNGDYTPSNCRWADIHTQRSNQRSRGSVFNPYSKPIGPEPDPLKVNAYAEPIELDPHLSRSYINHKYSIVNTCKHELIG